MIAETFEIQVPGAATWDLWVWVGSPEGTKRITVRLPYYWHDLDYIDSHIRQHYPNYRALWIQWDKRRDTLDTPLAYQRTWPTQAQALEDLAYWSQSQAAHDVGVVQLARVSDGWLVTACSELTGKALF